MNKLSKITLLVSAVLSAQAFAAETGKFQTEVYGKVGVTSQLDAEEVGQIDSRTGEDFRGYEDSKVGVLLHYGINKNFSVHSEVKGDFEGQESQMKLQELFVKGEFGAVDFEAGRFRTPLYMNSTIQDNDFELNTYRGVRGFSTQGENLQSALETVDGISFGYNRDLDMGKMEVRAFTGKAEDRENGMWDVGTAQTLEFETDAENVWGVESSLDGEFGKVRVAYLEAAIEAEALSFDFDSLSLGYAVTKGNFFADAEVARENVTDDLTAVEVTTTKGYVTVGLNVGKFTPSLTYSKTDVKDMDALDFDSLELGVAYTVNKNVKLKAAYEYMEDGLDVDDAVVSFGAAFRF